MSDLFKGNIALGGHITPTSPQDSFFVTTEEYHRGGYRTVENLEAANKIPMEHRTSGMKIYVRDLDKEYRCSPDLQSWMEISIESGDLVINGDEVDLNKLVLTDKEQTITEKKHFTKGLTSEIPAQSDNDVVRLADMSEAINKAKEEIGAIPEFNPEEYTRKEDFDKEVIQTDTEIKEIKDALQEIENNIPSIDTTQFATKNELNQYTTIVEFKNEISRLDKRIDTLGALFPDNPEIPDFDLTDYVKYDEYKTNIDFLKSEIDKLKNIVDQIPDVPDIDVSLFATKDDIDHINTSIEDIIRRLEELEKNPPSGTIDPVEIEKIINEKLKGYEKVADHNNDISNLNNQITQIESKHTKDIEKISVALEELKDKKINIDDITLEFKDIVIEPGEGPDGQPLPPVTIKNVLHVKKATSRGIGVVQPDNKTIVIDENGTLTSKSNKGDGITIVNNNDVNNTMSIAPDLVSKIEEIFNKLPIEPGEPGDGGQITLPIATSFSLGMVQPDNKTILVDKKGKISAVIDIDVATIDNNGIGKPDNVTIGITADGSYHVIDPIRKLGDLVDVDVNGMSYKQGYILAVDDTGTKFILRPQNSSSNHNTSTSINNTEYQMVYDLTKYINTAINLRLEAVGSDSNNPLIIKYVSRTGGEVEEKVDGVLQRSIPERDFGIQIYAKGKGKLIFDLLTLQ